MVVKTAGDNITLRHVLVLNGLWDLITREILQSMIYCRSMKVWVKNVDSNGIKEVNVFCPEASSDLAFARDM